MRKRILLAVTAFAATASAGGVAVAQPGGEAPTGDEPWTAPTQESAEVVLPTGETVGVAADGTLDLGEDGAYTVTKNADGDRLVVPADAVDEIAAGEYDVAAFNVDSPGAASETEAKAEEPTNVTLTGEWLDGSTPDTIVVSWVRLDSGVGDGPEFADGGTAELALEPGRYHLVVLLRKENGEGEFDSISSILEIGVGENPVEALVDGSKAEPLGFDLDREVVAQSVMLDVFSYPQDAEEGDSAWVGVWDFSGGGLYAVPTGRLSGNHDVGFVLREGLSSPEGTADPYSYNLFRAETDGLCGDLSPRVHDADLARIDSEYQSLGVDSLLHRMSMADHPLYEPWAWSGTGDVPLPSERTEFFTADPDLSWKHKGMFPYEAIYSPYDDVSQEGGVLESGSIAAMVWNDGPVTVGLDLAGHDFPYPLVYRSDEMEVLLTHPSLVSSGDAGEAIFSDYQPGKITLSQNGVIVNQYDEIGMGTLLSEFQAGRLELSAVTDREVAWTPLGSRSSGDWSFTYDPVGNPVQPVSVVNFDLPGIANGAVPAGSSQQVTLEFATQPGADDQACAAMTFEVSFDDGETWTDVAIDRDGDTATAAIEVPVGAAFGSVRFTAADENGNTVEHETIRSFAVD